MQTYLSSQVSSLLRIKLLYGFVWLVILPIIQDVSTQQDVGVTENQRHKEDNLQFSIFDIHSKASAYSFNLLATQICHQDVKYF